MSFSSVKLSITPLLIAGVTAGGSLTVRDRNQEPNLIPPLSQMPLVLLRDRASTETPLAVGFADRPWYLEATIWAAMPVDQDQTPFDVMREQLAQVLRSHTYAGPGSNDPMFSSQVYVSGRNIQMHDFPAIPSGTIGLELRHATVSCLVREAISITAVV